MWKVAVVVKLKEGVLDPQGKAIRGSLGALGYTGVDRVDVGKHIELRLSGETLTTPDKVRAHVEKMCEQLLANPVMERYEIQVEHLQEERTEAD